jgi:hypothetical protein
LIKTAHLPTVYRLAVSDFAERYREGWLMQEMGLAPEAPLNAANGAAATPTGVADRGAVAA